MSEFEYNDCYDSAIAMAKFKDEQPKSKPIDFVDIDAWDTALINSIDNETGEMLTLLDLLKDIDTEAKEYLFKDKTAQQKIDFGENM